MDKFTFIALWDTYRGLLTPTQQELTDMYFNLDLTPSEIAEQKGISRQGVSECLKTCKKQLEEYEDKLHFCSALREIECEISCMLTDAGKWAEKFKIEHPEYGGEIASLTEILQKDYSEEAKNLLADPKNIEIYRASKKGLKVD